MTEATAPTRMERRKEQTKQRIVEAAMKLFEERGFDGTTMELIADTADVAKGTLYKHFPVKEAIVSEYVQQVFGGRQSDRVAQLAQLPDTRSRLIHIYSELAEGVSRQHEVFEKYLVYVVRNTASLRQEHKVTSGLYQLGVAIIELGQKNGDIRVDVPLYTLEDLFEFGFIEVAKQYYMDPQHFNAREVIERCADIFLSGAGQKP